MFKLFLDDEREPVDDSFYVVRSFKEAVLAVETFGLPDFVSFDHDLGEHFTGYTFASWLVDYHLDNGGVFPLWYCHTQNPVGRDNINGLLKSYTKSIKETN